MTTNQDYKEAVQVIKEAILRGQYRAVAAANREQLSLYYGVGRYVSVNSRKGFWGKGAIEEISGMLQKDLPGLRGFSAANIKKMRQFYETWGFLTNRSPMASDLQAIVNEDVEAGIIDDTRLLRINRPPAATDLNIEEFLGISFSHHMEILNKTESLKERVFYIHQAVVNRWNKYQLRDNLKAEVYEHLGTLPNNFAGTIPGARQSLKAIEMFKDEYLLDFINVEELGARDQEDLDERIVENAIVANIKRFIMTFGHDFTFVGNQYRVEALGQVHIIDLLFFNRELNSLVAVELKGGPFKAVYLGQLNIYLQVLDDFVKKPHENASIGIVLCKDADRTYVEYAVRDYNKPMGVAVYKTLNDMPERLRKALPDVEELRKLL